jgi:hypothetical protein
MKHKVLKDIEDLKDFQREFGLRSSNPVSRQYLQRAIPIGYFKNGHLVGGYVINSSFPLRYFNWIPENTLEKTNILSKYVPGQTSEITCIWMDKDSVSGWERNCLYLNLVWNSWKYSKHWVFGGSVTPKVAVIQRRVMPLLVFSGRTALDNSPEGEIYCATREELLIRTFFRFVYESALLPFSVYKFFVPKKVPTERRIKGSSGV